MNRAYIDRQFPIGLWSDSSGGKMVVSLLCSWSLETIFEFLTMANAKEDGDGTRSALGMFKAECLSQHCENQAAVSKNVVILPFGVGMAGKVAIVGHWLEIS
jgi:hypothetical protein